MKRRIAATALLLVGLAACGVEDRGPQTHGDPTEAFQNVPPLVSTSPEPTVTSATTMLVPVYYLGGQADRPRLYREWRVVPKDSAVVRAAVDAMLHVKPLDADYRTYWPTATTVRGVSISGATATVDLSGNAGTVTTSTVNETLSLQQLVHTVTAAAPAVTSVRLRFDGATKPTLWGHVSTANAVSRAPQTETLAPVWVLEPTHLATVHRTFTVTGTASVFEATVSWVVTQSGAEIRKGFVNATAGGPGRGDYTVHVTLPPNLTGDIVFTAFESSAEDGSVLWPDSKSYTVS